MDADPHRKIQFILSCGCEGICRPAERALNAECRQQGALNVVLLRHRGPEHGHETVAEKLRDRASVAAYLGKAVSRNVLTRSRIPSDPSRSVSGVDPTMSQNSTVPCFISPGSTRSAGAAR